MPNVEPGLAVEAELRDGEDALQLADVAGPRVAGDGGGGGFSLEAPDGVSFLIRSDVCEV